MTAARRVSPVVKLGLGVLLAAVLGEAAVRAHGAATGRSHVLDMDPRHWAEGGYYVPHPYVGYVPRSGATAKAGSPAPFEVNSLGFRGAEIEEAKPPRTLRVACLGGSTTWGTGASSTAATWPARLQHMLQARLTPDDAFDHVEVINAGVSGYTLLESFVNFKMRVVPLQPDIVVVYHAVNDARVIGRQGFRPDYTHARKAFATPIPTSCDVLLGWSHLYGLVARRFGAERKTIYDFVYVADPASLPMSERFDAGEANFARTLHELVAVARVSGVQPVLTSFASTGGRPGGDTDEWMARFGRQLIGRLNGTTRTVAEFQATPFADVAGAVGDHRGLFVDPIHLSDAGNQVVAATVADAIRRARLLDGQSGPRTARPVERR